MAMQNGYHIPIQKAIEILISYYKNYAGPKSI